jgi:hypothetical protein
MGLINVEGIGPIEIKGDAPDEQESQAIGEIVKSTPKSDQQTVAETDSFIGSPSFKRLLLEAGLAIGGTVLSGGLALPATAARVGFLARPFLMQLGKSSFGSAVGSGTGAGIAQTFDPKDDVVKEVVRASIEGAVAEGIGGPLTIKGAQYVSKLLGPKINLIKGAEEAEQVLSTQIQKIKANPGSYSDEILKAADKAILTPGIVAENRFIDIAENIAENSILGSGSLLTAKEATKKIASSAMDNFTADLIKTADKTDLGLLFKANITNSQDLFDGAVKGYYKTVENNLAKSGLKNSAIVDIKPLQNNLKNILKELPGRKTYKGTVDLIQDYAQGPSKITFGKANQLRSDILALGRDSTAKDRNKFKFVQSQIAKEITKAIDNTSVGKIGAVKDSLKTANQFYKEGLATFNDKLLVNILKKNPDDIFNAIVSRSDKPYTVTKTLESIQKLTQMKNITGKPLLDELAAKNLKESLQGHLLKEMMDKSKGTVGQYENVLSASKLGSFMEKYKGTFAEKTGLFSKKQIAELDELKNLLSFSQGVISKEGRLPGGVFIQLSQAGAIGSLLTLNDPTTQFALAAPILLGPKAIGQMLINPKFNKFLREGLTAPSAPKARIAFGQLVGRLGAAGLIEEEELNKSMTELQQRPQAPDVRKLNTQPVNTQVTNPEQVLSQRPTASVAPTSMAPQQNMGGSGITSIPQERLQDYTNLFGRI